MKTRRVVRTNDGNYNTVWFGAKDVYTDEDGKKRTLFYNENDKHDNYAEGVEGVQSSLIQRLSIIRGELWYQVNYGLPLLDKIKNKSVMDASILEIITNHPQVKSVSSYISTVSAIVSS